MLIKPYITFATVFALTLKGVQCLYCLTCEDVPHARDCNRLKECGANEKCFHTSIVAQSGRITRRMGCRDKLQCPKTGSAPTGPGVGRRAGDLVLCNDCCDDKDFCQTSLCLDQDFPHPRGPICFHCPTQIKQDCDTFKVCGRDEICMESLKEDTSGTGDIVKQSDCYGRTPCETVKQSLAELKAQGKKRSETDCFNCCDTDLCNANCTMAMPTLPPTVSSGNNTPPACVDATSVDICRLAGKYVCTDKDKALNANCLHFCGYC